MGIARRFKIFGLILLDVLLLVLIISVMTGQIVVRIELPAKTLEAEGNHGDGTKGESARPEPVRVEVRCSDIPRENLMVALAFGQSNSANSVGTPKASKKGVYSFYHGRCYMALDPLPGATGMRGSVWTRLGDKIIEEELYDNVLFVPFGVGGSRILDWMPGGAHHDTKLLGSFISLEQSNFKVTHLLWHQGESDNILKRCKKRYKEMFHEMLSSIRSKGVEAPIYVSVATLNINGMNEEIQQAQKELVNPSKGIYPGPNTDLIGTEFRVDGVHFNDEGAERVADLWLESLKRNMH